MAALFCALKIATKNNQLIIKQLSNLLVAKSAFFNPLLATNNGTKLVLVLK